MDEQRLSFLRTLRRLPLFHDLLEEELVLIADNVSRLRFEKGAIIFSEGDLCRGLLIVEEGSVRVLKAAASGRQQLLAIERFGGSLEEVAVLDAGTYPASAEAISETTLLRLSAEQFRRICAENPSVALKVFKVVGRRMRHLVTLVEELSFATVRTRLIAHLLRLAEETGLDSTSGVRFELVENNEELAARLGTVRELISRNLGRLHGEGLITMKRRTVTIATLAELRAEIG